MPFEEQKIDVFMGGSFSLDRRDWTPETLAAEFRKWAQELDSWGDPSQKMTAEFSKRPDGTKIDVTLEKGIY